MNQELSARLKDENSLVREIGDKAEDVVWRRLKHYGVLAGVIFTCILGFIAFAGIRTVDDISKRLEPIVAAAEKRAQAAKQTIDEAAPKVDAVKASLDKLSHDVDTQTKRVAEGGGDTAQKLQNLNSAINDAQKRVGEYQARSVEFSNRLDAMAKSLDQQSGRVTQISKQVENVSIRKAYPSLGQEKYVTYDNSPWQGVAGKPPNEKWVNINIQIQSAGDYSVDQIENLVAALKGSGLTPLLASFGIGGPYFSGYGAFGTSSETAVFYFKKDSEPMATAVCTIVSKVLSITDVKSQFVNPAEMSDRDFRFVIEQSGVDVQIYLARK